MCRACVCSCDIRQEPMKNLLSPHALLDTHKDLHLGLAIADDAATLQVQAECLAARDNLD